MSSKSSGVTLCWGRSDTNREKRFSTALRESGVMTLPPYQSYLVYLVIGEHEAFQPDGEEKLVECRISPVIMY
jgi:hypothetical protein